jgi:hypothetical protein
MPVDGCRCGYAISERHTTVYTLHCYFDAQPLQELGRSGLDETSRPLTPALAVVPDHVWDFNQANLRHFSYLQLDANPPVTGYLLCARNLPYCFQEAGISLIGLTIADKIGMSKMPGASLQD